MLYLFCIIAKVVYLYTKQKRKHMNNSKKGFTALDLRTRLFTDRGRMAPATEENEHGTLLFDRHVGGSRYWFDENLNPHLWEQYDTSEDAAYFGVWVNKSERCILTFAEGDITLGWSPTVEQFNAQIKAANDFYGGGYIARVLDPERGEATEYTQDRECFFIV